MIDVFNFAGANNRVFSASVDFNHIELPNGVLGFSCLIPANQTDVFTTITGVKPGGTVSVWHTGDESPSFGSVGYQMNGDYLIRWR